MADATADAVTGRHYHRGVADVMWVVVVGIAILALLMLFRRRDPDQPVAAGVRKPIKTAAEHLMNHPVDPMVMAAIVTLLGQNKKIQAIKQLRDATNLGLADAKALVEAIQTGHRPPSVVLRGEAVDVTRPTAPAVAPGGTDLADRARSLRAQGREVDAIRLVCDETGMGILDAQKFVRALG